MKFSSILIMSFAIMFFNTACSQTTKIVNFPNDNVVIRQNNIVQFTTNYKADEYTWVFEGVKDSVSTKKSPKVRYDNIGHFSVKLIIKNNSESIILKNRFINVAHKLDDYNNYRYIKLNSKQDYWLQNTKFNARPGDIIVLEGSAKSITFNDFRGTRENPIRIVNKGKVNIKYDGRRGIQLRNCKHIIIDGKADPLYEYGIVVNTTGRTDASAVSFTNNTSNVEMFGVEIGSSGFAGIMAKTDPDPYGPNTWRYKFSLNNLYIHHNYIHDTDGEGMYIGYYTYEEKRGVKAHSIKNAKIWANIIENTGWDGFQIGCGDYGIEIHDNVIKNSGLKKVRWQQSGMSINSGFNGDIYDNRIMSGTYSAINLMPLDYANVYNNIIVDINKNKSGIYIQNNSSTHYNCNINIFNNYIQSGVSLAIQNKSNVKKFNKILFVNNILAHDKETIQIDFKPMYKKPSYLIVNNIHEEYNSYDKLSYMSSTNNLNEFEFIEHEIIEKKLFQYYVGPVNYLYQSSKKGHR